MNSYAGKQSLVIQCGLSFAFGRSCGMASRMCIFLSFYQTHHKAFRIFLRVTTKTL